VVDSSRYELPVDVRERSKAYVIIRGTPVRECNGRENRSPRISICGRVKTESGANFLNFDKSFGVGSRVACVIPGFPNVVRT
jgi:hypothetical protein